MKDEDVIGFDVESYRRMLESGKGHLRLESLEGTGVVTIGPPTALELLEILQLVQDLTDGVDINSATKIVDHLKSVLGSGDILALITRNYSRLTKIAAGMSKLSVEQVMRLDIMDFLDLVVACWETSSHFFTTRAAKSPLWTRVLSTNVQSETPRQN